ncbi:hypothetical protein Tdes44962_MAKER04397 [Teratosphaeria destructans]|uniref:Uncharacterized protein n=1 Tax=Teratosphaeria destructans TaxID=418781 RepID=A0A9W7W0D8_9PEZI|nr:hypothetical protein Tdes44962_MAKER04397 [Teratosphaeria destructans]
MVVPIEHEKHELGDVARFIEQCVAISQSWKFSKPTSLVLEPLRCLLALPVGELHIVLEAKLFKQPSSTDRARGLEEVKGDLWGHIVNLLNFILVLDTDDDKKELDEQ